METAHLFEIGDICQTKRTHWFYAKQKDGNYRISLNDKNNFKVQPFMLLSYPFLYNFSSLDLEIEDRKKIDVYGIKILIENKIRYYFFHNNNLSEHITLVI